MLVDYSKSEIALKQLKTFNRIKAILFNCASEDKRVNIHMLNGLLKEIKVKIEIAQKGLGSYRLCKNDEKQNSKSSGVAPIAEDVAKDARGERHFMQQLNLLSIDRILNALSGE
jgi:hypothetical protein